MDPASGSTATTMKLNCTCELGGRGLNSDQQVVACAELVSQLSFTAYATPPYLQGADAADTTGGSK